MASSCLYAALSLNIPDHLAGRSEDRGRTGRRPAAPMKDALFRILRLLASLGIFEETAPRTFALTPGVESLAEGRPRIAGAAMAVFLPDPMHYRIYGNIMESLATGKPCADTTLGMPVCRVSQDGIRRNSQVFNDAMTALSAPGRGLRRIEAYDFQRPSGRSSTSAGRTRRSAHVDSQSESEKCAGILADIGHVVDGAEKPRIASSGLSESDAGRRVRLSSRRCPRAATRTS